MSVMGVIGTIVGFIMGIVIFFVPVFLIALIPWIGVGPLTSFLTGSAPRSRNDNGRIIPIFMNWHR